MRGLSSVLLLTGMLIAVPAWAQTESSGSSDGVSPYGMDPVIDEFLAAIRAGEVGVDSNAEYLYGTPGDDTIVYGDIVIYGPFTGCTGYSRWGRGICIFARTDSAVGHYRGTPTSVATWSAGAVNPLGLGGDPWEGPTWRSDRIYAADLYGESYIQCASLGPYTFYVAIDHAFSPACGDGTAHFPSDTQMEIRGDGGADPNGSKDWINGWKNNDTLLGDGGDDEIYGHAGTDVINGDTGGDVIYGGSGEPCGSGTEWLYGGFNDAGIDYIFGAPGGACQERLYGGPGNDSLYGTWYADYLSGGDGVDFLKGYGGADYEYGGNGNDALCGPGDCDGVLPFPGDPGVPPGDTCFALCGTRVSCETNSTLNCP